MTVFVFNSPQNIVSWSPFHVNSYDNDYDSRQQVYAAISYKIYFEHILPLVTSCYGTLLTLSVPYSSVKNKQKTAPAVTNYN